MPMHIRVVCSPRGLGRQRYASAAAFTQALDELFGA